MEKIGSYAWFVAGAVIGGAFALLYAPKTGKETRDLIGESVDEGQKAVIDSGKDLIEKSKDLYERGRQIAEEAAELFEKGRQLVRG